MTEDRQRALLVANILPSLNLQELEEGCKAFIKDIEEGDDLTDVDFLFPYILDRKLKYYEEEY